MKSLNGKVAVVTGASKGIGAEIAKGLAAQGAAVVVNYATSKEGADKIVGEITKAGGKAIAVGGSVANPADIEALFAAAKKAYGKVDILVNNAGIYTFAPLEAVTAESIASIFNTNVAGLLLTSKAALSLFPSEGGSIINIGSVVSDSASAMSSVYAGSNGAVNTITRVLAKELGPKKIRVNAVNPGVTVTEGYKSAGFESSSFEDQAVKNTPLGRVGHPDDIAGIVTFLASEDARWVTGSLIEAAGGFR
jgi:3-oxoacyl-[acyl-carrier protein] reductase